jgi:organic hydroperoxide reductase OsmC/OhrA
VRVLAYEGHAQGVMRTDASGGGQFEAVTLHPAVTIDGDEHAALALQLHDRAHELCFIARSCSVPIRHEPRVVSGGTGGPR